jgi:hypothetical protein
MTDSPTAVPAPDCAHVYPPILASTGEGAWTATCRELRCQFRCGSFDPDIAVPEHWKQYIPMLADTPPATTEPERDDVLLLLRAVVALVGEDDGDGTGPLLAYRRDRDLGLAMAVTLRDRLCALAYDKAARKVDNPAFVAMHVNVIASDMLSLAMVPANPDPHYTTAYQLLRSMLANRLIHNGVDAVELALRSALRTVEW